MMKIYEEDEEDQTQKCVKYHKPIDRVQEIFEFQFPIFMPNILQAAQYLSRRIWSFYKHISGGTSIKN